MFWSKNRASVLVEEPRVEHAAVQHHERLALAMFVVPGADARKLDVTSDHALFLSVFPDAGCRM
jgi:hypothetical protein